LSCLKLNVVSTNEQLGYLVFSGAMSQQGILFLRLLIQSSDRAADYLDSRAEAFLNHYQVHRDPSRLLD